MLDAQRPVLLIGSPMCIAFSNLQNLNKNRRKPEDVQRQMEEATGRLDRAEVLTKSLGSEQVRWTESCGLPGTAKLDWELGTRCRCCST